MILFSFLVKAERVLSKIVKVHGGMHSHKTLRAHERETAPQHDKPDDR